MPFWVEQAEVMPFWVEQAEAEMKRCSREPTTSPA